jgi:hypothetical protein
MTKETYTLSGFGKVTTYNWMVKNAEISLNSARATEEGRFFHSMNVLVYSAFAMEAFFNHLGIHLHSDWDSKERQMSKFKKLRKFKSELGLKGALEDEPFRSVTDAFNFRDLLAHGRTESIDKTETIELTQKELKQYMVGSAWMDSCNLKTAERIFCNVRTVISSMYKAAGLGDYPFTHFHSSGYGHAQQGH